MTKTAANEHNDLAPWELELLSFPTAAPVRIERVLGFDDWLVYARTVEGGLVYTVAEHDGHWLDAPHRGEAEYGSDAWREDNWFMLEYIKADTSAHEWTPTDCGQPWPTDDRFVAHSAKVYLPR